MCTLSSDEKERIREEQKEKDRRQNCKQHCTKIAQGLDKLDEYSSSRAIWELVQNARDLSSECEIKITLTENEFVFAHKGKPFTYDSLNSLVKQVSSEEKEDENNNAVGQYGTGFITTHSFGRIIKIDGSFEVKKGFYVDIDNFIIDREFNTIDEFIQKMSAQIKCVEEFVDKPTSTLRVWTKLKYQLNAESLEKAKKGLSEAEKVIPYVMTLNDRIKKIEIDDQTTNRCVEYCRQSSDVTDGLHTTIVTIVVNGYCNRFDCYYLESEDKKDRIIMPLESPSKAKSFDGIPKLFLYFPLLGTENFGMNFIFHSERFSPEEARNGIFLPNKEKTAEGKYNANVKVLDEMKAMLFKYLSQNIANIDNAIDFASIDFDTTHKDEVRCVFFKKMQTEWVSEFEKYPIIETAKGKLSISQYDKVKVLSEEVAIWLSSAEFQDKYLPAVYNLASKCCNLPFLADILKWSSIIKKWKSEIREYYIGFEDIAKKIDEESDDLRMFIDFIRESKNDKLFNLYAIIPNREGELMKATELRNANDIFGILYESASRIIPKITKSFVKESYSDTYAFSDYTRTNLRNDINSKVSDWKKDFIVRGVIFPVETENNLIGDS